MTEHCPMCELMQDDADLDELCDECRAEVVYLLDQRRAGEY
jgi:hypothetical protein